MWVRLANEQLRLACLRCARGTIECHGPSFPNQPCRRSNLVSTRCACLSHDSNPKPIHRSKISIFELCLLELDFLSYSFQIRYLSASFELITDTLVYYSTTLILQPPIFAELVEPVQLSSSVPQCPCFSSQPLWTPSLDSGTISPHLSSKNRPHTLSLSSTLHHFHSSNFVQLLAKVVVGFEGTKFEWSTFRVQDWTNLTPATCQYSCAHFRPN